MKLGLLLTFLLASFLGQAQTLREESIKAEMLGRVDTMIKASNELRSILKKRRPGPEDMIAACEKMDVLFVNYPDHLLLAGRHLNLLLGDTQRVTSESLNHLMYVHRQSLNCKNGSPGENIDRKAVGRTMKEIQKTLKQHRKIIKRAKTSFDNNYSYEYKF